MKRLGSDEIKAISLNILKELHRVCTENDLTYSIAYGTALGAARHGGFIPWDDDIDVVMPRADYERLFQLCAQPGVLRKGYRLATYRDKSSIYQFFKLIDTRTVSYEIFVGKKYPLSLWVDIFPLEPAGGIPDRVIHSRLKKYLRSSLLRSLSIADPNVGSSAMAKFAKKTVGAFARHLDPYKRAEHLDRIAQTIQGTTTTNEWVDFLAYCRKLDGSLIFPTRPMKFEDSLFQGPARIDEYLRYRYGDWMTLPPTEERVHHMPEAYLLEDESDG